MRVTPTPRKKNARQNAAFRQYTPQAWSPFWLMKPASKHAHARLLHRFSWTRTVLLPSDTHTKPITSIKAILLPFVTYLPILSRIMKPVHRFSSFPFRSALSFLLAYSFTLYTQTPRFSALCRTRDIQLHCVLLYQPLQWVKQPNISQSIVRQDDLFP
jgi:hypothetical protein